MKKILVTGGAGFIGSHTVLELLQQNYEVVVIDNLSNSKQESLRRVEAITGKSIDFYKTDLLDTLALTNLFKTHSIDGVIHFAALKAVGESVEKPLLYYKNNVAGTLSLCEAMSAAGVKNLVFSSSATVYGDPDHSPLKEENRLSAANPYGQTKLTIEYILKDICRADKEWNIALLRYFNPVGAHQSGMIGEDPNGIPNNLMPFVTQVAIGKLDKLNIFGNDYPTPDGTAIRDYIHVTDLANGHLKALVKLHSSPGIVAYNLGTGKGTSVLELVKAFEKATSVRIPYQFADRRPGDAAICYADTSRAERELDWQARFDLEDMCRDAWNWQTQNPGGYS